MSRSKKYQDDLVQALKDPEEAAAYLNASLEAGEPEAFLLALRNVAEAHGGMGELAKSTNLNRENLYRMLSKQGNPELQSLALLLNSLGFRLAIEVNTHATRAQP